MANIAPRSLMSSEAESTMAVCDGFSDLKAAARDVVAPAVLMNPDLSPAGTPDDDPPARSLLLCDDKVGRASARYQLGWPSSD